MHTVFNYSGGLSARNDQNYKYIYPESKSEHNILINIDQ